MEGLDLILLGAAFGVGGGLLARWMRYMGGLD